VADDPATIHAEPPYAKESSWLDRIFAPLEPGGKSLIGLAQPGGQYPRDVDHHKGEPVAVLLPEKRQILDG
jgi:hypothetical protein